MKNGREHWYPDLYKVKRKELLDPKLSPTENMWSIIYKVTCVWLTKARVFALTQEDMEELEQDVRLATYLRLRYVVVTKQYNKKYNFWTNCTRCCYSICHSCIQRWMDKLKVRKNFICGDEQTSDSDNSASYFDLISFNPTLITSSENPCNQKLDWKYYSRPYDRWKRLNEQINDAYMEYEEECISMSIDPIDKESFIRDNFSKEEQDLVKQTREALTPNALYLRNWYQKKKAEDPDWWARRLEKQKEYSARNRQKRKERYERQKAQKKKAAT
jgi:hypothetical protein